ncbi:HlyD family efflux transporter periplasmic adaptor subunit [Aliiglaciecola sp. LCG003]|uniref:HlyD family secretion protein n=1 Tax=Aliiglaciecola sp. LCG003 TaxID=3053655 RepID=UPI0025747EA8|nr:HlyD family efflux transporter periplasmic adaptor subunit [Aliiglaciecola sp. LCG003]WJG09866.1 HlyD family efflux transporter periplasmic adaptor subunit [Aliiglaciecola sp. LCG003]
MQEGLFRQRALEHQQDRLHGEVLLIPSTSIVIVTSCVFIWLVAVFVWLVGSQYARQETVSGWLEPSNGVVKIFPQSANGRIKQVLVSEGQSVTAGQELVVIQGDRTLSDGSNLEKTLLDEYSTQQKLVYAQLETSQSLHNVALANAKLKLAAAKDDLFSLSAQIDTLTKRQTLLKARIISYRGINANGHIANIELDKLEEQQLALQSEEQALLREQIQRVNQQQILESQLVTLPQSHQDDVNQLKAHLSELSLKVTQLSSQQGHIIKASRAGTVSNLQAYQGQRIDATVPLLSIVPDDTDIQAKLLVSVRAAGFIAPGQKLEIRYDGFPYQKFGLYAGEVTQVSDSIILPGEVHATPVNIQEPVYLVHATLSSQQVSAYGKNIDLKSGMTLSADVQLDERSLLEWIFEPLLSLRGRM